ncbi:adenylate/guanylate cyclase domain-containing protein [Aureimonas endophytica]|nr:adenylate/guanylate cyclase domain-containing protein [Aureimonas endophytica]
MKRRLAAIMAGDVVGYSRMMAEDETATYRELRSMFDEIVAPAVHGNEGRIFKQIGDGFLASFTSAHAALEAAEAIQTALAVHRFELRIGINLGDVIEENGDTYGDGVNVAARLEAMARPGAIYVSDIVRRSVEQTSERAFRSLGRRAAKNMPTDIVVYELVPPPAERPAPRWRWPRAVVSHPALTALGLALVLAGSAGAMGGLEAGSRWIADLPLVRDASSDARPFVAVMPFNGMGADPSHSQLADGLSEDLITELSRYPELAVVARNSTFALRGQAMDVRTIGRILHARYVVEGSARRQGEQLRIAAQLVDTETGTHIWAKTYDREVTDVFAVQSELSAEIVASLVPYLRRSEAASVERKPTKDLRAYDLVVRARGIHAKGHSDAAALTASQDLLQQALALDPDYAEAHAYLALNLIQQKVLGGGGDVAGAIERARRSIGLAPDLALGYRALGYGLAVAGNYADALQATERSVELNPNDPEGLAALAKAQLRSGSYQAAAQNAARARELHPMAPDYYAFIEGQALYAADQPDQAANALRGCLLGNQQRANCLRIAVATDVRRGKLGEAMEAMRELMVLDPGFTLEKEAGTQRYGTTPVMRRYIADLREARPQRAATIGTAGSRSEI